MKISREALELLRSAPISPEALEASREAGELPEPTPPASPAPTPEVFHLADLRLDMAAVHHLTPGLEELADAPIEQANCVPDEGEEISGCEVCRLVIVIGKADAAITGALKWALERAKEFKGCFELWRTSSDSPFQRLFAQDIRGGVDSRPKRQYTRDGGAVTRAFSELLPNLVRGQGRIDELLVFHHGAKVKEEDQVVVGIGGILATILGIPVCRVVYWSCNAAAELNTAAGGDVDAVMREFARLSQESPCGCEKLVELIKPTEGKCGIKDPATLVDLSTGDGKVKRIRWGYLEAPPTDPAKLPRRLMPSPDPNDPHPFLNPQPGAEETVEGEKIMGVPVAADPNLR